MLKLSACYSAHRGAAVLDLSLFAEGSMISAPWRATASGRRWLFVRDCSRRVEPPDKLGMLDREFVRMGFPLRRAAPVVHQSLNAWVDLSVTEWVLAQTRSANSAYCCIISMISWFILAGARGVNVRWNTLAK
jgi:hypothetical protein